jgi:hypothetical protein
LNVGRKDNFCRGILQRAICLGTVEIWEPVAWLNHILNCTVCVGIIPVAHKLQFLAILSKYQQMHLSVFI